MHRTESSRVSTELSIPYAELVSGENLHLKEIGEHLIAVSSSMPVTLIPLRSSESMQTLITQFPGEPLCVCDFPIEGAEKWHRVAGGFQDPSGVILNIDHHAPHPDMFRFISSGNLAAHRVREHGIFNGRIVNNHTDCDSVVTRLLIGGEIPPLSFFEDAVLAADHTGEAHPVADLLQALDIKRDLRFSTYNLGLLLTGQTLEPKAQKLLSRRHTAREATQHYVQSGKCEVMGGLGICHFDGELRNEFLPGLMPTIAVFLSVEPLTSQDMRQVMRLRLGKGAPEGMTLFDLGIDEFDPAYGGRWNAGSNSRGGGSVLPTKKYAERIAGRLNELMAASRPPTDDTLFSGIAFP
jgi:hypothetical protein